MSAKATLRKQINACFIVDPDLDAFIMDYFDDVWKTITRGMSRQEKLNQLFSLKEADDIEHALINFESELPKLASDTELTTPESSSLRREIARLQQIIRELEQQLAGRGESNPKINSQDGLQRIQSSLKEIEQILSSTEEYDNAKWLSVGHSALSSLVDAFGFFHNIPSDFRWRFLTLQAPISQEYKAILEAGISVLGHAAAESARRTAAMRAPAPQLGHSRTRWRP
jgi:hypothetical protein